ncbi:ferrochelatase [Pseudoblastomonas halimionae]|uniref:Ferrochelatase n=1 Tax=Alteriqipengyuania halimionae TaxID=1926630 RepID=A0A6I4TYD6_9SPHN|nr:ferrochelatase [Alteriqipengyuania halimionae]MXP08819.1 ferrochelatase [Alteriqipengyuania halimionae]
MTRPPHAPDDHPSVAHGRVAVLLSNLGTPDAPDAKSVKRYLGQFLSDRRVVEIPPIAWQPILRGIILNTRPKKSAEAYAKVWGEDGSPLAAITAEQTRLLQQRLGEGVRVEYAMRYGNPDLGEAVARLKEDGFDRILLAPLYPQYCSATTATAVDAANAALAAMRWQPSLRTLPPYYDDPLYIAALADDLERQIAALSFAPEMLLLSFHGMPQRTLELGDPYHCHCRKTARLLWDELGPRLKGMEMRVAFQSRFGRAKWLEPATDATLERVAKAGTRRLAIAAPGFSADCLETREELAMQGREQFMEAGGEQFAALDCLNASPSGMDMLEALVRRELSGWL